MTPDQRAIRDLPALQDNLRTLVALASKAFPLNIGKRSHLRFMLASFAMKQIQHARSVLRLGTSLDTMLIARSMLEGLSQVLWAVKQPRHRPLLWRAFAFVLDSRQIQRYRSEGRSVDAKVKHNTRVGLARYGRWFLTKHAREARATGRRLPADPYTKNWYGEREIEIFQDVGGQVLWEHAYGPFSDGITGASVPLVDSCPSTRKRRGLRWPRRAQAVQPLPVHVPSSVFGRQ